MDDPKATARFVAAADRLVNLLATQPPASSAAAMALHNRSVEEAYNEYDLARQQLTGEKLGEE